MRPSDVLGALRARLLLIASRVVLRAIADSGGLQALQVEALSGELLGGVERFGQYGLTSRPKAGAEGILLAPGGSRDQAVVVAVEDRRYRLRGLAEGEVALYDDLGTEVRLARGGKVSIKASHEVSIDAPTVRVSGNLLVAKNILAEGQVGDGSPTTPTLAAMRGTYNFHQHPGDGVPNNPM